MLSEDELRELQDYLRYTPDIGKVISGTGGCRKVRWALSGMGKRGGIRVIYYYLTSQGIIYLLLAYPKNEMDNLSQAQRNQLRQLIEKIEEESWL